MKEHVNDEQLTNLALGEGSADAEAHLKQCEACTRELDTLRAVLSNLPQQAQEAAQQEDSFWRAQRLAISERISRAPGQYARAAWGLAFASMLLMGVLLNRPTHSDGVTNTDPDHELLVEVERSVRRVPRALAPAELLVAELNTAAAQANP